MLNSTKNRDKKKAQGRENAAEMARGLYRAPHANRQMMMELCNSPPAGQHLPSFNLQHYQMNQPEVAKVEPKLTSSKSLSRLTRSLFFRSKASSSSSSVPKPAVGMTTTRSLPNCPTIVNSTTIELPVQQQAPKTKRKSLLSGSRSSSKSSSYGLEGAVSLEQPPNVSPIVGSDGQKTVDGFSMSTIEMDSGVGRANSGQSGKQEEEDETSKATKKKFKPFKSTGLVLRDVKNSLALRMRAKHDSQAFCKFTNDSTPTTKLYSPFNIYLEGSSSKDAKRKEQQMFNRNKGYLNNSMELDDDDCHEMDQQQATRNNETPAKLRIALQHKRHLIQANKFTFDSPAGKLKETVRDVEQFQQCIEDISKAIKARR